MATAADNRFVLTANACALSIVDPEAMPHSTDPDPLIGG
jgi:hypothetical protein